MVHKPKCGRTQTSGRQQDTSLGKNILNSHKKQLALKEVVDKIYFNKLQTSIYKKPL